MDSALSAWLDYAVPNLGVQEILRLFLSSHVPEIVFARLITDGRISLVDDLNADGGPADAIEMDDKKCVDLWQELITRFALQLPQKLSIQMRYLTKYGRFIFYIVKRMNSIRRFVKLHFDEGLRCGSFSEIAVDLTPTCLYHLHHRAKHWWGAPYRQSHGSKLTISILIGH